jgi:hypothetical protein
MNTIRIISLLGKLAGLVTALDAIPFVSQQTGVLIFAAASILKDAAARFTEILRHRHTAIP